LKQTLLANLKLKPHDMTTQSMYSFTMETIDWNHFSAVDMRAGTIVEATPFPKARNPSYQLRIDLGPLGIKQSSAQITALYSTEQLIGKQVVCVVNLGKRNIAGFESEVLVTGFYNQDNHVVLATTATTVPNGSRLC
jgi:tRNA-binding protein